MQGGLTLPEATYYSSADRSAVLDEYGIRIQELCMLVRMSVAAANSTAHDAIAVEATMARLSRFDARQSQQLPTCVDSPMVWARKCAIGACQPLGAEHGACAAVCDRQTQQGWSICTAGSTVVCPCACAGRAWCQNELSSYGDAAKDTTDRCAFDSEGYGYSCLPH
jgi:hypothetical protein